MGAYEEYQKKKKKNDGGYVSAYDTYQKHKAERVQQAQKAIDMDIPARMQQAAAMTANPAILDPFGKHIKRMSDRAVNRRVQADYDKALNMITDAGFEDTAPYEKALRMHKSLYDNNAAINRRNLEYVPENKDDYDKAMDIVRRQSRTDEDVAREIKDAKAELDSAIELLGPSYGIHNGGSFDSRDVRTGRLPAGTPAADSLDSGSHKRTPDDIYKEKYRKYNTLVKEAVQRERDKKYYEAIDKYEFANIALKGRQKADAEEQKKNDIKHGWGFLSNTSSMDDVTGVDQYEYMTDDEKDIYGYLLEKEGSESADEYKKSIIDNINSRKGQALYEAIPDNAAVKIASGLGAGYGRAKRSVMHLVNDITGSEALPVSAEEYAASMVRESLGEKGPKVLGSSLGQAAYDVLENTGNMVPSIAAGYAGGPIAAAATVGVSSGASAMNEEWRNGASKGQAAVYGAVNGALEGGLQYALGGISKLGGKLTGVGKGILDTKISNVAARTAAKAGLSALGEGTEEYLQEIIDPVVRNLTLGEDNKIRFVTDEALYAGMLGAVSGLALGGPSDISEELARTKITEYVGSGTDIEAVVGAAKDIKELKPYVEKYEKSPTDYNAGMLKLEFDNYVGKEIANAKTPEEADVIYDRITKDAPDEVVRVADEALSNVKQGLDNINADTDNVNADTDNINTNADNINVNTDNGNSSIDTEIGNIDTETGNIDTGNRYTSRVIDTFSKETRNAMEQSLHTAVVDEVTYKNAFANYYSYGRAGLSMETADGNATFNELTDAQKVLAYRSGVQDRQAQINRAEQNLTKKGFRGQGMLRYIRDNELSEGISVPRAIRELDERQKSSVMALRTFAEVSGQNIVLYESQAVNGKVTTPNGWYNRSNDTIYIDVNAGDVGESAILRTASHEITHAIKEWSPKKYAELQNFVTRQFEQDGSIEAMINEEVRIAKSNGQDMTLEEALDEVVANSCEMMLKDTGAIERMAEESPSLCKKIKLVIDKVVSDIKKAFEGLRSGSLEHKRMNEILESWSEVQKLWDDAAVDSARNAKKARKAAEGVENSGENVQGNVEPEKNVYSYRNNMPEVEYGMKEEERYNILSKTNINVVDGNMQLTENEINNLEMGTTYKYENFFKLLGEKFGIYKEYTNGEIQFKYSKSTISESIHKIKKNPENNVEIVAMMANTKDIIENAVPIIIHDDKYKGTVREDKGLKNVYVMMGMFENKGSLYPVEIVVKNRVDGKNNLYMEVVLNAIDKIKGNEIISKEAEKDQRHSPTTFPYELKITDVIRNVNSEDANFLKYFPQKMLSKEQLVNVEEATEKENIKIEFLKNNKRATVEDIALEYKRRHREDNYVDEESAPQEAASGIAASLEEKGYGIAPEEIETDTEDVLHSYRGDTRSDREILADALMGATKNTAERNELEAYKRIIGKLDMQEKLRREKVRMRNNAEDAATRDKYQSDIDAIDKKIALNDRRLIRMEAAAPLRAVIKRETKANAQKDIEYIKARHKERQERKTMTTLRNNIKNNAGNLITLINKPTNQRHVPEALKKPVADFLGAVDFISAYADPESFNTKQWQTKMEVLRHTIDSLNSGESTSIDFDPDLLARMKAFSYDSDGKPLPAKRLSDMGMSELEDIYIIVRSLRMGISNANRMFANKRSESAEKLGCDTVEELSVRKDKKNHSKLVNSMDNFINVDLIDPTSFFRSLGKNAESVGKELRAGRNVQKRDIRAAREYMDGVYDRIGLTGKEFEEITGDKKVHTFKYLNGEFKMTTGEIMSLYCLKNRKQAMQHMIKGGITVDDFKYKGKVMKQTGNFRMTEAFINEITSVLTEKEKRVAEAMQSYMANQCAEQGNETSMTLYGYKKFNEKEYFPISSDKNWTRQNTADGKVRQSLTAIVNVGMTKELNEKAENPIRVSNIYDVFSKHVADMADYHGLAVPLVDASKWYNYVNPDSSGDSSVKQAIKRVFGEEYLNYYTNFIRDINGDSRRRLASDLTDTFVKNFKATAVAANMRVVVQQPTAYVRAAAMMDTKYLMKAVTMKPGTKEAVENSEIAWWKSEGFFDTGLGPTLKALITNNKSTVDKIVDKSLYLAGKADDITWGCLWNAVKLEVADKNKGIDKNSPEYMEKVKERFEDIIYSTQVVDDLFSKSQIMRHKDGATRSLTSFMAEPIKTYNMLRNAVASKVPKAIIRTSSVFVVSAAANAALAAIVDAMRSLSGDDDKDKSYGERWMDSFLQNMADNANPLNLVPYLRDLVNACAGYSSNKDETVWMTSTVKACQEIYKAVNGDSKKTPAQITALCAKAISQMSGIPVANALRTVDSIYNEINATVFGKKSLGYYAERAAVSRMEGDIKEYESIVKSLQEDGYTIEDINKKVRSYTAKLNKSEKEAEKATTEGDEDPDTGESMYKAGDVLSLVKKDDVKYANEVMESMFQTELAGTPDRYEAYKKVKASLKAQISKYYKTLEFDDRLQFSKSIRKLVLAKQYIYTNNDIKILERTIAKEKGEKNKK